MTDRPHILLAHHLKTPRLPTFPREYEKVARQCAAEGLDHVRFLARLVELEPIDRERRMVERRIKAAKFPVAKSLDSFDFKAIPALNKAQVLELARCEWIERRENVIALGPSGTGKTHVALGLGLAACHVWRARIVLLSGAGLGTSAIMGETDKSKTCVWRWQERFMHEGVGGLLRDKSRPPGKAPIAPDRVAWIVRQTQQPPPHEATHWTLRAMAKAAGVAASTVQAIWKAHGLSPHRWRNFKLSNDPAFAEKLADIVGLYVDPPAHAVVLL